MMGKHSLPFFKAIFWDFFSLMKFFIVNLICALLLSINTFSYAEEQLSTFQPAYTGQLKNGLTYTLVPLSGQGRRIDIRMIVKSGALDQTEYQSGVAHMVEHMVFYRSQNYQNGLAKYLQSQGWERGKHYNAMTNAERTIYMFSPPQGKKELSLSLNALAEIAHASQFNEDDLKQERQVILEEWRGKLGVAERMNQQRMKALRFGSLYPLRSVTGDLTSIQNMPFIELKNYYQTWYQPNNIQLLIVGDIQPKEVIPFIEKQFSDLTPKVLPQKASYDVELKEQLRVVRLKDSESGSSQISYVYRFNDVLAKVYQKDGLKQRLLHQITLEALTQQLKYQQKQLDPSVSTIVVRKSEIGAHQFALGFFADVTPGEQNLALPVLLKEIAKLKYNNIPVQMIEKIKHNIALTAKNMANTPEKRDFSDWIRKLVPLWQQGENYVGSQSIGQQVLHILPEIKADDVNELLHHWLNQTDQLVQYSIPREDDIDFPNALSIKNMSAQWPKDELKLEKESLVNVPKLRFEPNKGTVVSKKNVPDSHVTEWVLGNGDRLVWLNHPLAQDQIYFTAVSSAGFSRIDLNSWQAQIASQLVGQTGQSNWTNQMYTDWKKNHKVNSGFDHQSHIIKYTAQSSWSGFKSLVQMYAQTQQPYLFTSDQIKQSAAALVRIKSMEQDSVSGIRRLDIQKLRFNESSLEPTIDHLKQLTVSQLVHQWNLIRKTPTTYYIVSAQEPDKFESEISTYLATPKRALNLNDKVIQQPQQQTGYLEKTAYINIEPRAEIRAWSITNRVWSPEKAIHIYIAKTLAEKKLRYQLRDQMQGIYRMTFNSELDDIKNVVQTDISFTASPDRALALWKETQNVLSNFHIQISENEVIEQVQRMRETEKLKQQDIFTLQKRLILSDIHYNDPRYLDQVNYIYNNIKLSDIQSAAQSLYNPNRTALYMTFPAQ